MAERRNKTHPRSKRPAPRNPAARVKRRERNIREHDPAPRSRARSWFASKRPVLRFVLVFGLLLGVFYAFYSRAALPDTLATRFFARHIHFCAQASGAILNTLGREVAVDGGVIRSPAFTVRIIRGCDGMEATALFVCAVLALPVRVWRRLVGVAGGVLALGLINLARIVSLFYVGVYWPDAFDTIHFDVWQTLVVVLAILLWATWAWWATRSRGGRPHVSA